MRVAICYSDVVVDVRLNAVTCGAGDKLYRPRAQLLMLFRPPISGVSVRSESLGKSCAVVRKAPPVSPVRMWRGGEGEKGADGVCGRRRGQQGVQNRAGPSACGETSGAENENRNPGTNQTRAGIGSRARAREDRLWG